MLVPEATCMAAAAHQMSTGGDGGPIAAPAYPVLTCLGSSMEATGNVMGHAKRSWQSIA